MPVINENDTTATDEISFGDNDFLAAQVAILTGADLLVLLTDIDGLFTADRGPRRGAELVAEVADFEACTRSTSATARRRWAPGDALEGRRRRDGDRGRHPAVICNGIRDGALAAALAGEPEGTRFPARALGYSSFKLWLRYAKPAQGTLVVDAGAARALREGGTSLLPVGIAEVRGTFDAGEAVEIVAEGRLLGKGISSYSADELRQVVGMKSAQVREILRGPAEEAVHRDYFVLA